MPRFFIIAASLGVFLLLSGCAGSLPRAAVSDATVVWSDTDGHVWLQQTGDASRNNHPAELSEADVRALLQALRVEPVEGRSLDRTITGFAGDEVLTDEMQERLAGPLRRAFAQATPQQDVLFTIRGFRSSTWSSYVGRDVVTSGRLFRDETGLQVIIGEINTELDTEYRHARGPEAVETATVRVPHGYRDRPASAAWQLVERDGVRRHDRDGTVRADWVVLDLPTVAQAAAGGASGSATPGGEAARETGRDPRERLEMLREMYEDGLIPEDVYRRRVQEIADEI